MEKICRACEIAANDELVKQMPMHTCGKDGPMENADALKTGMKEQDAAHSFTEGMDIGKIDKELKQQFKYVHTLHNINMNLMNELTTLRSELQQERELRKELAGGLENFWLYYQRTRFPYKTQYEKEIVKDVELLIAKSKAK